MCGGFTCSKNSLIALNVLYVVVAITLMSVAAYAKLEAIVSSISLVSGIIACGVFLLLISIVGIVAASKHHQVLLFFYMIILFLIFIIQFSVACACLAINENQQSTLAKQGWSIASGDLKKEAEVTFHCCGYDGVVEEMDCGGVKSESGKPCCPETDPTCCSNHPNNTMANSTCNCNTCNEVLQEVIGNSLSTVGGIGLFFSFTEFVGVWLTVRYRNQRDPRANPSAFL